MLWRTPPNDIWHRIYNARRREAMKSSDAIYYIESSDIVRATRWAIVIGQHGNQIKLCFPDRTPAHHVAAVTNAINAALAAAREVESHGRD